MSEATVFIVEDDAAVADALAILVHSIGVAAQHFTSADDFLAAYEPQRAGCLVSDVCLPGTDGMNLQHQLRERGWEIPLIVMSGHGDISMAVEMMRLGALDFVEKPFRNHTMLTRIREALALDAQRRRHARARRDLQRQLATLTPREREILDLLMSGAANKQVARQLALSTRTVETHRANVLRKMAATSVTELVQRLAQTPPH